MRRIPYPYLAMLAICSDLDETPDKWVYWEGMRFLNTRSITSMGRGLGLEVGNTIYFDMPPGDFSYWNTDDAGRAMIRALIRSGHLDCLHSYGDLATTRSHAGRALEELSAYGCRIEVWVDHSIAPTNFGPDIMRGLGDVPGSVAYHADLTCGFGVKYVWRGRTTSVIGQDVPRSLRGIYNTEHPFRSVRTVAKEFAKGVAGRVGSVKYAMHGPNEVMREIQLRNGNQAWEFMRSNPFWGGVNLGATAEGIAEVLMEETLLQLIDREGVCILYAHLGKIKTPGVPFESSTREALAILSGFYSEGKVLVTTTQRLLEYCRAVREVDLSSKVAGDEDTIRVDIQGPGGEGGAIQDELDGLTFYVPDPARVAVSVNGREVSDLQRNGPDQTGRKSVSLPWRPLEFPETWA